MKPLRLRHRRAGLTLVEVVISSALLSIVAGIALSALAVLTEASETTLGRTVQEVDVSRAMETVVSTVRPVSIANVTSPNPGASSSTFRFKTVIGFNLNTDPPTPIYSPNDTVFRLVPDDTDEDRDGNTNESFLVMDNDTVQGARLLSDVTSLQFSLLSNKLLAINITVERPDPSDTDANNRPRIRTITRSRSVYLFNN